MPEMDGIEAIRRITASQPRSRILVITSFATDDKVFPAIKAGALGYLLKDSDPEALVGAIRQVYRGKSSLHPKIAAHAAARVGGACCATADPRSTDRTRGRCAATGGAAG